MKDVVEKLLREKRARYLTKEYIIKKYNEDVYNKILKRTSYLPDSCNLQLRIYHILHGLYEPCKCLTCGKELYNNLHKFNIDVKEYLNVFCSNTCMRSYKFNFSGEPPKNIEFNKENITKYVKEKSIDKIKRNFFIMKEIQCYIYSIIGDDYKRMGDVEAIYFIKNNLSELPKCKITGEYLRYKGAGKYFKHSSLKASAKDKKTKDKRKRTSIELYGVENVSQNKRIKEKIMNTHFNRYNSHYCKSEEYKKRLKSGEIQRKALSDEKREIIKLQNYKRAWKTIQSFKDTIIPLFSFEDYEGCGYDKLYKWKCVQTGKEFEAWYNFGWVPKSPHIYTGSDTENIILKYLKRNNISFVKNYRKIIPPQEIDFYIP